MTSLAYMIYIGDHNV